MEEDIELGSTLNNCSGSPYDSKSYAVVAAISASLAFVSLMVICCVIAIMILFKKWKFFSQRLILYLSISAILVNVGIILHRVDYENQTSSFYVNFCKFGGFFDQVSNWMLLNSICSIMIYISLNIFFSKNSEKYEIAYFVFIFIFPITFTWIPFIKNSYGQAGAWCWIRSEDKDNCEAFEFGRILQLIIWFVPLYTIMIILIITYVMLLVKLYLKKRKLVLTSKTDREHISQIQKDLLPLIAYPLIYFLLNIFPFINRIYNHQTNENPSLVLWYLAALANPSVGPLIALAFTLDPGTRKRLTVAEILAAVKELCRGNRVVKEYEFEVRNKEGSFTSNSTEKPPYKSYEECYKLNMMDTKEQKNNLETGQIE